MKNQMKQNQDTVWSWFNHCSFPSGELLPRPCSRCQSTESNILWLEKQAADPSWISQLSIRVS